jgi:hypothetical protein
MVVFLFEMSSCGVCLEAPSLVQTGLARSLFPEGHGNFFGKIGNIGRGESVLLDKCKHV